MERTQHTQGEWTVERGAYGGDSSDITVMCGDRSICDIIGNMPVDIANAKLIAAAPKMLAALQEIATGEASSRERVSIARAAIFKATEN